MNLTPAVQIMQRVVATSLNHIRAYRTGGHLSITHMQIIALGYGTNGANGCFVSMDLSITISPLSSNTFDPLQRLCVL